MAMLAPEGPVYQAGTLSGNPVAAAAGLATLRACTPEVYARLDEVAEKWCKKLEEHKEMAFTCREIARLQTDLQLDGNLQQLRLTA